jgi:ornithine cyclodeaminase/alanine dehydrogenase-like protein (mu-crystallin family)
VNDAIDAIRALYARPPSAGASARAIARGDGARLRALVAVDGAVMGAKLHAQARGGSSAFLLALFDADSGRLLGLLDGREVTATRTAATSAYAVDLLARPGPLRVGILGSGREAHAHVRALRAVREIESLSVYSPTRERREAFAREHGAEAVDDPGALVESSPVVVCAARSRDETPILDGDRLRDDAVVVSIGSTVPEQRELDARTLERAAFVLVDEPDEVLDSGDGRAYPGLAAKLVRLGERLPPVEGIAVFKSVGSALQDVAVARTMLDGAATIELSGKR